MRAKRMATARHSRGRSTIIFFQMAAEPMQLGTKTQSSPPRGSRRTRPRREQWRRGKRREKEERTNNEKTQKKGGNCRAKKKKRVGRPAVWWGGVPWLNNNSGSLKCDGNVRWMWQKTWFRLVDRETIVSNGRMTAAWPGPVRPEQPKDLKN